MHQHPIIRANYADMNKAIMKGVKSTSRFDGGRRNGGSGHCGILSQRRDRLRDSGIIMGVLKQKREQFKQVERHICTLRLSPK